MTALARAAAVARGRLGPPLVLTGLAVAFFAAALFGGRTLYGRDIATLYFGQSESLVRCVAGGSWPLWNPFLGFGQPLLADPGLQVLYPPTWLNFLVPVETYYAVYAAGHVLLAGLGVLALGRTLRLSRAASLLAACAFMLSGPLLSMVVLWQHLAGAAWLPWVLRAQERALRRRTTGAALAWGATLAAQILTGSVDMVLLGLVPAAGLLARRIGLEGRRVAPAGWARAGLLAGVTAGALTAALWVPALELLARTGRAEQPEAMRLFQSLHPLLALQALVPVDPVALPLQPETQLRIFGPTSPILDSLYLGVVVLLLALVALRSPRRSLVLALLGTAALGLWLALGSHGWLMGFLQGIVPPLRVFRFPVKALVVCSLASSLLAGVGLDGLGSGPLPARMRAACWGVAALEAAAALGLWLHAPAVQALSRQAGHAAFAAACAAVATHLLGRRRSSSPGLALGCLVLVDLVAAHLALNPTVPRELLARPPQTVLALNAPAPRRVFSFEYAGRSPFRTYRRTLFAPPALAEPPPLGAHESRALARNLALVGTVPARWGIYGSFGFEPVVVPTREQLRLTLLLAAAEETPGFLRLLQVGGVQFVLAFHEQGMEGLERVASILTPYALPLSVYRVPATLPRAYLVSGARVEADGDARVLLDPAFDPQREVLLRAGSPRAPDPAFAGQVHGLDLGCDRVRADVQLDRPGFLVLLDAYDPGWQARVDGAPAAIARANTAFRAVPLGAGRHAVELLYRPRAVLLGAALSASSLVLLVAWLVRRGNAGRRTVSVRRARSPVGRGGADESRPR